MDYVGPLTPACNVNGTKYICLCVDHYFRSFGVLRFTASVPHPSSVGLVERYAQITMGRIRLRCVAAGSTRRWGLYVRDSAIDINTRCAVVSSENRGFPFIVRGLLQCSPDSRFADNHEALPCGRACCVPPPRTAHSSSGCGQSRHLLSRRFRSTRCVRGGVAGLLLGCGGARSGSRARKELRMRPVVFV